MIRTLHPELLDTLPADDASAIGSRRDLRRLNSLMGHARVIARSLETIFPNRAPARLIEIGAGDGQLLLRAARINSPRWIGSPRTFQTVGATKFHPLLKEEGKGEGEGITISPDATHIDVLFIDLHNLLREETKAEFAALNWRVRAIEANIFDWLSKSSAETDVVLANLVLHHFTDAQLALLFSEISDKTNAFIAVEPRRGAWPLFCACSLGLIGCNAVTRHDAPVSVRAGFTGRELSTLWPHSNEWEITERRAGLFSHLFVARRKGT